MTKMLKALAIIEPHSGANEADWLLQYRNGERPSDYRTPQLEPCDKSSDEFHFRLRSILSTEVPCQNCTNPVCSCSGFTRTDVAFIPGEREWIERHTGGQFRGGDSSSFNVCGDCAFLKNQRCSAGWYKPWDCIAYPLQPTVIDGKLVPFFGRDCSIHPGKLHPRWIQERWAGWQFIFAHFKDWFIDTYDPMPIFTGFSEDARQDEIDRLLNGTLS